MNVFNNIDNKLNLIKEVFSHDDFKILDELNLLVSYHHDYFEKIQDNYCNSVDELKRLFSIKAIEKIDFEKQMKDLCAWRKNQQPRFSGTIEQEILYDKIKTKGIKNHISYDKNRIVLSYQEYYVVYNVKNMPEIYGKETHYYNDKEKYYFDINFRVGNHKILDLKEIRGFTISLTENTIPKKRRSDIRMSVINRYNKQKVDHLEILNQNICLGLYEESEFNNFINENIFKLDKSEIQDLALFNFDFILDLEKDLLYSFLLEEIKRFSFS